VKAEWSYAWRDDAEDVKLAKTEHNTVEQSDDSEDGE
jgi:hypothetical protein